MVKKQTTEVQVKASSSKAWSVYSTLKVCSVIQSHVSHLTALEIVEGSGKEGTVVKITPQPGT